MQSIGEVPVGLLPSTGSPHGRPSIGAINAAESQDVEDGVACPMTTPLIDTSANKSPINASSSK